MLMSFSKNVHRQWILGLGPETNSPAHSALLLALKLMIFLLLNQMHVDPLRIPRYPLQ